jgi:hypothetical protein
MVVLSKAGNTYLMHWWRFTLVAIEWSHMPIVRNNRQLCIWRNHANIILIQSKLISQTGQRHDWYFYLDMVWSSMDQTVRLISIMSSRDALTFLLRCINAMVLPFFTISSAFHWYMQIFEYLYQYLSFKMWNYAGVNWCSAFPTNNWAMILIAFLFQSRCFIDNICVNHSHNIVEWKLSCAIVSYGFENYVIVLGLFLFMVKRLCVVTVRSIFSMW